MNWNNIRGNKIIKDKNINNEKDFNLIEKRIIYIVKNQLSTIIKKQFNIPNKYGMWVSN